ncbi:MAG: alkaline phosphatase [Kiritimatiellae bacterium]|nr:alkaline phosphatase [Kiritimatiellia bacterium]
MNFFLLAATNVILFIGDGMSTPQRMVADEFARYAGHAPLVINRMPHQATMRTCSASNLVTDSAASATAIACGVKTYNGAIGVDPNHKSVYSIAYEAKKAGRKVGIATTVTINHATPSGFYGHRNHRGEGYGLGLDLLDSGFDFFAGGGAMNRNDKNYPGYRGDLYELAPKAGYKFIDHDRKAFDALKKGDKAWFVASTQEMPYSIDAAKWKDKPTLAEITAKGLEVLENDKGFFFMIEAGKIDYAGHANDPAANLHDVLALDDAVKTAIKWAKSHPDTLIVVTGDHETGGMTMGFAGTGYNLYMDKLAKQKCSADYLTEQIRSGKFKDFNECFAFLKENFGMEDKDRGELESAWNRDRNGALPTAVKLLVSHKSGLAWTSNTHTALPVLTTAMGRNADKFIGFMDNTDIARILKEIVRNK